MLVHCLWFAKLASKYISFQLRSLGTNLSYNDFSSLKLKQALLDNLASLNYQAMTPIQAQSLPHVLNNKDVIAQGKTGSGKTAAFGLGVLQKLNIKRFCVQSLVLCPTRELADQVATEIRRLARGIQNIKVLTVCGGSPIGPQIGSLEHGVHIVVGTPGRVEDHLRKQTLSLDDLNVLVLDEADRMLDMGFQESIDNIIEAMPAKRQTLLFSATFPESIQSIARRVMIEPVTVQVESMHSEDSIEQYFFQVEDNKALMTALRLLLMQYKPESALVFCNTKQEANEIASQLHGFGFNALTLHGDLQQKDREQTLVRFANKSVNVLVATDVAARGLDIEDLEVVFNYHLPRELEVYTHRIGRTGRAGNKGIACSVYTGKEQYKLNRLENYLQLPIQNSTLPKLSLLDKQAYKASMITMQIDGGKKHKLRPGDILGALTSGNGVNGRHVGKINIFDLKAYVAVDRRSSKAALKKLKNDKLKGRTFKAKLLAK